MEENNPLQEIEESGPVTVCDIRFRTGTKTYYFDPNGIALRPGDHVIIETSRGPEFGYCHGAAHEVPASYIVPPLRKVLRIATDKDEYLNNDNHRLEQAAYRICQEKVEKLGLDMQLVSCEVAFDGSKILFYFTADGRVDFRELVKQLASTFHTRVELRQIGVRDKAKMVGGLGICGRPFCCGQFLNDFAPVSIKMAKTQNLSLNPTKISGTCGRLMCCLKYEQEAYEDLLKTSPKVDSFVDTPEGRGTVTDVNLMGQSVKVRLEKDPDEIVSYRNEEIAIFRNGKPKKTDEPVPDDWAPISGGKPKKPAEEYPRFERVSVRAAEPAEEPRQPRSRREKKPAAEAQPAEPKPAEPVKKPEAPSAAPEEKAAQETPKKQERKTNNRGGKKKKKPAPKPADRQPAPAAAAAHETGEKKPAAAKPEKGEKHQKPAEKKDHQKPKAAHGEKPAPKPEAKPQNEASAADAAAKKQKKRRYYHRPKKQG